MTAHTHTEKICCYICHAAAAVRCARCGRAICITHQPEEGRLCVDCELEFGRRVSTRGEKVLAAVTFFVFVRQALLKMAGGTGPSDVYTLHARTTTPLRKRPGRYEFQRGVLEQSGPGEFIVRSAGAQGSGILRSMSEANCFILLDPDRTSVNVGEQVEVQPFQNFI